MIHPCLRPSAARDRTRWRQCAVSMTFFPTAVLAAALATLKEILRWDGQEDQMEENARRVQITRCSREKRDISRYMLEDEDLSHPTSITATQFRIDVGLPYPFFFGLANLLKVTPYIKPLQKQHKKSAFDPTDDRRVAIHNPVGNNHRSVFNPHFRLNKSCP